MVSHAQALLTAAKPAPIHNEGTEHPFERHLCIPVLWCHLMEGLISDVYFVQTDLSDHPE